MYTFYESDTGVITRVVTLRPEQLESQILEGESVYEGEIDTVLFDKVVDGSPFKTDYPFDAVAYARFVRNQMLMESDWTQAADAPFEAAQKNELRRWRQSLRDFPTEVADCTSEQEVQDLLPIKPRV